MSDGVTLIHNYYQTNSTCHKFNATFHIFRRLISWESIAGSNGRLRSMMWDHPLLRMGESVCCYIITVVVDLSAEKFVHQKLTLRPVNVWSFEHKKGLNAKWCEYVCNGHWKCNTKKLTGGSSGKNHCLNPLWILAIYI